jgi:hypothetical protein
MEVSPKNVAVERCLFEQKECAAVGQTVRSGIGYDQSMSGIPTIRWPKGTMSMAPQMGKRRPSSEIFELSLILSVVIAVALTSLQTFYRSRCKTHKKVPRAIL